MSTVGSVPNIGKPLLTIAIPTYNRAGYLHELLSSIFDQVITEPCLELLISDNASSDETCGVIAEFQKRGLSIRAIRNKTNIGPDANFLQCFEQARGKYFWLFSDDDLLAPGAISKIISYCYKKDYDLLYIDGYGFDGCFKPRDLRAHDDVIEFSDVRAFTRHVHIFFTFISGNIVNKDRILACATRPFSSLIGTGLVQLSWTYTALNGFKQGLFIREKLIAARLNNSGGYSVLHVFGSTLARVTDDWINSETIRAIIINGTIQRFWPRTIFEYKAKSGIAEKDGKPQKLLVPLFGNNARYWFFVHPILVMPCYLAAFWLFAVRVINRIDKAAGYLMLN